MPKGVYSRVTVEERFWEKVQKTENCWIWLASKNYKGYGQFGLVNKIVSAHRYSYELLKGIISSDLQIDHLCRNRACVNSAHLELVTSRENTRRGNTGLHERIKTVCPKGHMYSEENTYLYQTKNGRKSRACRICHARRERGRRTKLCALSTALKTN